MLRIKGYISALMIFSFVTSYAQTRRWLAQDSIHQMVDGAKLKMNKVQHTVTNVEKKVIKVKDSVVQSLEEVPDKFIKNIDNKIETYSGRITKKTIKTLEKLSRWEVKIKKRLEQVSPETAHRLFSNQQLTFAVMLQKVKEGESISKDWHGKYDEYRDKLSVSLKYLDDQKQQLDTKLLKPLTETRAKMDQLTKEIDKTELLEQLIKERKKKLIDAAFQSLGKSKYLTKMNKEVWYYAETMRNYKELFNDPTKAELAAKKIFNEIPAFHAFMQRNSMLASLFGQPGDMASAANLTGLQTRTSVQNLIQNRIAAGGANAQQIISQNMQQAQAQLNQLKDKLLKNPAFGNGGGTLPDFKPNMQKTKTFKQRLEWGTDLQFVRSNSLMPTTSDIALTVGYKINDKSVIGIGCSYKLGLGTIDKIRFSTQGAGIRSFIDWKLKHQFYISGGYEMNYLPDLKKQHNQAVYTGDVDGWQRSALLGISKKLTVKTKWFKSTKLQLLYDFLGKQHVPVSQSMLFRVGYNF